MRTPYPFERVARYLPAKLRAVARLGGVIEIFYLIRIYLPEGRNQLLIYTRAAGDREWYNPKKYYRSSIPLLFCDVSRELGWPMVTHAVKGDEPFEPPESPVPEYKAQRQAEWRQKVAMSEAVQ